MWNRGIKWDNEYYIDTCLPFGFRHGSTIFQKLSDSVRFMVQNSGYKIINYLDDFIGFGVPSSAQKSYEKMYSLLQDLGLTKSE